MIKLDELEKWIVQNVTAEIVPADEGSTEGLIYNLVQLARDSKKRYNYLPEQDAEIRALRDKYRLQ